MKNLKFHYILLFFLAACAQPKYLNEKKNVKFSDKPLTGDSCSYQFVKYNLCLNWYWEGSQPQAKKYASVVFYFYKNESPQNLFSNIEVPIKVKIWMDSMNHGGPGIKTKSLSNGTFHASGIYFIMERDWTLRFQLGKEGQESFEEIAVPLWIEP